MKILKAIGKVILGILLIPLSYIAVALILTLIPVNRRISTENRDKSIYIASNGVHLDIVIPVAIADTELLRGLKYIYSDNYLAFGWGDKNFYLNTPEWSDLTFKTAFVALFLRSKSLVHMTRYAKPESHWIEVELSQQQLETINSYLLNSFATDSNGNKMLLDNRGYFDDDDFYEAKGYYTCLKSSNSWVNDALRKSDLKACLWTPFDFGVTRLYR